MTPEQMEAMIERLTNLMRRLRDTTDRTEIAWATGGLEAEIDWLEVQLGREPERNR